MFSLVSRSTRARQFKLSSISFPRTSTSSIHNNPLEPKPLSKPTAENSRTSRYRKHVLSLLKLHPYRSTIFTACVLSTFVPSITSASILYLVGLGDSGPVSGWPAARFQSYFGPIQVFRLLQSTAMGGGSDTLDGYVSGTAMALGIVVLSWNRIRSLRGLGRK